MAVRDVTPLARKVRALVRAGEDRAARELLPDERPYPAPEAALARLR
ncbi:hypothetical protein DC74_3933 [Streptomyces noursei]|uniref:Uncharacterized protein n=1 Tax=Streptomyces noursei TaxID=1971 RepID=A0A059VYH3_STRNR|nr:hypothetical protein DC74_3933 [Streptomyces noursei]GCB91995.1 hypothetical protein SALB_04742 [Streptomyces noursei]